MITELRGYFNNYPKLEIAVPDIADVSAVDYTAKKYKKNGEEDNVNGEQLPFYPCHPKSVQMKVETWLGKTIPAWIFTPGEDPIPLKKIFADPAPVEVVNGTPTATEITNIQVGY